jgi:hypothetical protein
MKVQAIVSEAGSSAMVGNLIMSGNLSKNRTQGPKEKEGVIVKV